MQLYLDNYGSKWIDTDKEKMKFVLVMPNGKRIVRKADYFYSLGNFAGISYRVKGKRFNGLPKANDGTETRLDNTIGIDALPHIFHDNSQNT